LLYWHSAIINVFMPTRTLCVIGQANIGTVVTCVIDGLETVTVIDHNSANDLHPECVNLYQWVTDTRFHGWKKITVTVSNSVLIQRTTATYPAVWVDDTDTQHWGHIVSYQRTVPDPKYLVCFNGKLMVQDTLGIEPHGEYHYTLHPGITMTYYHIMRGGYDYVYLHLEHQTEWQQNWIATKKFLWKNQDLVYQGILQRPYAKKFFNQYELDLIKSSALEDFKSFDHEQ